VRPEGLAEDAVWDAAADAWATGATADGKRAGEWTFTRVDGSIAGRAHYVDGVREGHAEWFHMSGDLREQVTYVAGKLHGRRAWQRTKKGKVPGFEWFDKLGASTWRYEVPHVSGVGQKRYATQYGKSGVEAQVPATAEGRSIELGEHMDLLEPQTVLMLVEEYFIDAAEDEEVSHGSVARIARGVKTARGRYVYLGRETHDVFRIQFEYDDGRAPLEHVVESGELTRAFTLASDYFLTARAVLDPPRNA
jgi:hypothetical protein